MVDFKFDALYSLQLSLHKEPPEVGLVKKLTGSLYWWVEQCVPNLHREWLPHSLILMMKKLKNFQFLLGSRMDFQRLARPRNVSVDLKYDVLCL